MFHYGHFNLLQQAKTFCDYLIVGVNSDELVEDYKHKKPVVSDSERSEIVSSIVGVDNSVIIDTLDKIDAFTKFNFN